MLFRSKEVAEYRPIIDFIEAGGNPEDLNQRSGPHHDLIIQMMVDLGLDRFYTGGASDLGVVEVDGIITERNDNDGNGCD